MVTGDYHHTAIAVARGAGMIPKGSPMLIIQAKSESDSLPAKQGHSRSATEQQGSLLDTACRAVGDFPPSISRHVGHQESPDCDQIAMDLRCSAASSALVSEPVFDASQLEAVKQGVSKACGQDYACLTFTLDSQGRSASLDPVQALTHIAQVGPPCSCLRCNHSDICNRYCACSFLDAAGGRPVGGREGGGWGGE